MGYWDATDRFLASNPAPKCPHCHRTMAAADDHGRFICLDCPKAPRAKNSTPTPVVIQVEDKDE